MTLSCEIVINWSLFCVGEGFWIEKLTLPHINKDKFPCLEVYQAKNTGSL